MTSFPSDTFCPACGGVLRAIDSTGVRKNRPGRRVADLIFPVTAWWCALILVAGIAFAVFHRSPGHGPLERGFGWLLVGLPVLPGLLLWIVSCFFPDVRIYRCKACGATTEHRLKPLR